MKFEGLGASAVGAAVTASPVLVGTLLAAGAFYMIENRQGTTVVHIDNLTINLNAEMVHQLNMNPKEVINQLAEQIKKSV